ncbi:hypothetical protein BDR07DRAFT_1387611 [Suillus spraguei]|nr:hypothetical protein BDR07DRAFT_1387611 [Suillus spraguei]
MHVCLLPTEIISHIIFNTYGDHKGPAKHATLAALARTCRKFKEPALDSLWKDIDGFKPLVSCLPEGVSDTNMGEQLTLSNPEWRLLDRYARRIHRFTVSEGDLDLLDDRVVQVLISTPLATPLLSNLRSLVWTDDRPSFFPLLRALFGSTITSMKLGFRSTYRSFALSALLASLGARCPSIRELDCACSGDSDESSDLILCRLQTGVFHTGDLVRLASLPSLKSLHFDLMRYNIEEQLNFIPINFSDSMNAFEIGDVIYLSEGFSPTLEELVFELELELEFSDFDKEYTFTDPGLALHFDAVVPLLSFSCLTDLRLDWICTSAIDDTSLKTMAQSWPLLETFWFGGAVPWVVPPSLTFIGFVHLIHCCRRLCSIQMSFRACPVDVNSELFSKTIPNKNIAHLSVGVSPIIDPIGVASQLRGLLPKLAEVRFFEWPAGESVPPPFEHYEDGWSRVNEFLTTSAK